MKGLLKSLEAVIGALIIAGLFVFLYTSQETLPESDTTSWKITGFNALKSLDWSNELRPSVYRNDTETIKSKLLPLIPSSLSYDVQICSLNCTAFQTSADRVVAVEYLLAGDVNNVTSRQVVLYIWSGVA